MTSDVAARVLSLLSQSKCLGSAKNNSRQSHLYSVLNWRVKINSQFLRRVLTRLRLYSRSVVTLIAALIAIPAVSQAATLDQWTLALGFPAESAQVDGYTSGS